MSLVREPFMCTAGEAVMSEEVIEHVAGVVAEKGTDVWWAAPNEVLLPPSLQGRASSLTRGQDTMDVYAPPRSTALQATHVCNSPCSVCATAAFWP